MIEMACRDVVFHFNKHHLKDPSTPMWVIKTKGKTFYINHVDCQMPWSTKETPDSEHTKGAIKIKKALLRINDENEAVLTPLTDDDAKRLEDSDEPRTRILIHNKKGGIRKYLMEQKIPHGRFKTTYGGCGTTYHVVEVRSRAGMVLLSLIFDGAYRILQENEYYYKEYDGKVD